MTAQLLARLRAPFALSLLAATALVTAAPAAQADPFEVRTYLDISKSWSLGAPGSSQAPALRLAPFLREESRFREAGLGYVKTFAGLRLRFPTVKWLSAATYYAHKDLVLAGKPQAHMAVVDVFLAPRVGPFVLWDKSGFEAHLTDGFFRYRNAFEVRWRCPLWWLTPFARAELRVDSDAGRVNLFDGWLGVALRFHEGHGAGPATRIFYGYEAKRRGKPNWAGLHMLGVAVAAAW